MPLNPAQEARDARIAVALESHGWTRTTSGVAFDLAHMFHKTPRALLTITHLWKQDALTVDVEDPKRLDVARALIYYSDDDSIERLVDLLIAWQHRLTSHTFLSFLQEAVQCQLRAYRLEGEVEPIEIQAE